MGRLHGGEIEVGWNTKLPTAQKSKNVQVTVSLPLPVLDRIRLFCYANHMTVTDYLYYSIIDIASEDAPLQAYELKNKIIFGLLKEGPVSDRLEDWQEYLKQKTVEMYHAGVNSRHRKEIIKRIREEMEECDLIQK